MQGIRQSEREGENVGGERRSDEHWMSIQAIYLHGGLGITYTPRLHLHTVERLLAAEQGNRRGGEMSRESRRDK